MRVAIVAPEPVPYTFGGTERAVAGIVREINARTSHVAELVGLPVDERSFSGLLDGYRAFARLDLTRFDQVISVKYPAWAVSHPHHTAYLFHRLRGVYDTYDTFGRPRAPRPADPSVECLVTAAEKLWRDAIERRAPLGELLVRRDELVASADQTIRRCGADHPDLELPSPVTRVVVRALDAVALTPDAVRRHLALSRTVAARPDYFPPGVRPGVVYLPPDIPGLRRGGRRHLFTASRLDTTKRVTTIAAAMAHTRADLPLLIAGSGPQHDELARLAGSDPRIQLLGFVDDADLATYYADALAVPFIPLDEDYGLITVEAMASGTPVITSPDAGGPAELVDHWVTGLVVAPTPKALAAAFDHLAGHDDFAAALGAAASERAADLHWDTTIAQLLGDAPPRRARPLPFDADVPVEARRSRPDPFAAANRPGFPRVVVLSTYRIAPARYGGPVRCNRLLSRLAASHDLHLICLGEHGSPPEDGAIAGGIRQTVVPITKAHAEAIWAAEQLLGVPLTDLYGALHIEMTPAFLHALRSAATNADAVIVEHPYLITAVEQLGLDLPLILDEHNVELDLKSEAYPGCPEGRAAAAAVGDLERRAALAAQLVVTVSEDDAARLAALTGIEASEMAVVPNGADLHHRVLPVEERTTRRDAWLRRFDASDGTPGAAGETGARCRQIALFLGSWHPPNLDAARWIFRAARQLPEVLFLHGGTHAGAFGSWDLPPNVVLLGPVSERVKDTLLGTVDVALNPMRQGSGTNLKLLEYMAAGVPVVSSAFGARGLVPGGEQCLRLCEPADLTAGIREVLDDPAGSQARAARARDLVERFYGWDLLAERFAAAVGAVTDSHRLVRPVAAGRLGSFSCVS